MYLRCLVVGSICAASTGSSGPPSSQNGPIRTHEAVAAPLPPGRRGGFSRSFAVMPLPKARRIPLRIIARPSLNQHKKRCARKQRPFRKRCRLDVEKNAPDDRWFLAKKGRTITSHATPSHATSSTTSAFKRVSDYRVRRRCNFMSEDVLKLTAPFFEILPVQLRLQRGSEPLHHRLLRAEAPVHQTPGR